MVSKKAWCCLLVMMVFSVMQLCVLHPLRAQGPGIKAEVKPKQAQDAAVKTPADGKQPIIEFDEMQFDAGEVWEGEIVTHSFVVRNAGNAELTISNVKPG